MDSVLKQRIKTAVVLIVAVIVAVLYLPNQWFAVVALVALVSLGGWEWSRLVSLEDYHRGLFVAWLLLLAFIVYKWGSLRWILIVSSITWWAGILVLLTKYKQGTTLYNDNKLILRVSAFLVLPPAWIALVMLQQQHPLLVLYLIFLVAIADSGAYFTGKALGKNKLAPQLSPGKTREGMLGGLAGAVVWAILGALFFKIGMSNWLYFITLSVSVALLSVAGDLFESLIKREAGQKDSGNILPGHGGILDRVDGLIATLPLFTLGIFWGNVQV